MGVSVWYAQPAGPPNTNTASNVNEQKVNVDDVANEVIHDLMDMYKNVFQNHPHFLKLLNAFSIYVVGDESGVPTAAVSPNQMIFINAKYWKRLDDLCAKYNLSSKECLYLKAFVIDHELLHWYLRHFKRLPFTPETQMIANIAGDAEINEYLASIPEFSFVKGIPDFWGDIINNTTLEKGYRVHVNAPETDLAEDVYKKIKDVIKNIPIDLVGGGGGGKGKRKEGSGGTGGIPGPVSEEEGEEGEKEGEGEEGSEKEKGHKGKGKCVGGKYGPSTDDVIYDKSREEKALNDPEKKKVWDSETARRVRSGTESPDEVWRRVSKEVLDAAKKAGTAPGALSRLGEMVGRAMLASKPIINWNDVLRNRVLFFTNMWKNYIFGMAPTVGFTRTYKWSGVTTPPSPDIPSPLEGLILPASQEEFRPVPFTKVYVLIDVSGSINDKLLGTFLTQVYNAVKSLPGVELDVWFWDVGVVENGKFVVKSPSDINEIIKALSGDSNKYGKTVATGGGTAFSPVLNEIEKEMSGPRGVKYPLMFIFSDGYIADPSEVSAELNKIGRKVGLLYAIIVNDGGVKNELYNAVMKAAMQSMRNKAFADVFDAKKIVA